MGMNNLLVIWGASGHGKVVLDVARGAGRFERIVFVDDDVTKAGLSVCGCPTIGTPDELQRFAGGAFVIAVGDNRTRARCFERACEKGLAPAVLVDRTAIVSPSAALGAGTAVMPGAIVNADAVIGENCIVNSAAVVEHDCRIGAHVHISPRAVLGGGVSVGPYAHIGIGAVLLPGATVGEEAVVGAGAVVLKVVAPRCTVAGVPARLISPIRQELI
jgi:sugar O-acyltransferase (sialic acid O-acetyltransferase NeuD family)